MSASDILRFLIVLCVYFALCNAKKVYENRNECNRMEFIHKCCPLGKYVAYDNFTCTELKYGSGIHDFSDVPLYYDNKKKTGRNLDCVYTLVPGIILNETFKGLAYDYSTVGHNYYLSEKGVLYDEDPNQYMWWNEIKSANFCIDYKLDPSASTVDGIIFLTVVLSGENNEAKDFTFYVVGLFISCFFLMLVVVVFCLLPGPKQLSEKVQMSYVISTLGAFSFMGVINVDTEYPVSCCIVLTYFTYFFFLASFCWMTIMSYDLWRLHSHSKHNTISKYKAQSRFKWYSACAWGITTIATSFLIFANHANLRHIPGFIQPNIPNWRCFIHGGEKLLYLYIPLLILISCNWIFFIITSIYIWKQYKDTSAVDINNSSTKRHRTLRNRFLMYLKLSIITGLSWFLEVVSHFFPNLNFWYVTDAYNLFVGVSIFLIFVCNKRVIKKLKIRFRRDTLHDSDDTDRI